VVHDIKEPAARRAMSSPHKTLPHEHTSTYGRLQLHKG